MSTTAANWIEQARDLRRKAEPLPAGLDREDLLRQAEQLEAAAQMSELLTVRKPPRQTV